MTEITQADRDAAAEHIPAMGMANSVLNGKSDNHTLVRAFARHRMEERAAIVAWLRDQQTSTEKLRDEMNRHTAGWHFADEHASSLEQSAAAIEAKEHLK